MPSNIPSLSLKTIDFKPNSLQFAEYKPDLADGTILASSLAKQQEMKQSSNAGLDTLGTTLTELKETLDPSEYKWFEDKQANIKSNLSNAISYGNYESAINMAQQFAIDLKYDKDLENKKLANARRQQAKQAISSGKYSTLTQQRWDETNKYYDDGSGDWKAKNFIPVEDISLDQVWFIANQTTPNRQNSTSTSVSGSTSYSYVDANGNPTKDLDSAAYATRQTNRASHGSSLSVTEKREEDIEKTFYNLLQEPKYRQALKQEFENNLWAYNKYTKDADDINLSEEARAEALRKRDEYETALKDENGFLYSEADGFDKWLEAKSKPMFKSMSYKHISTGTQTGTDETYATDDWMKKNIQAGQNKDAKIVEEQVGTEGTPISVTIKSYLEPLPEASVVGSWLKIK